MSKLIAIALIFILTFSVISFAANEKPYSKIERGSKNLAFGWTEIPKAVVSESKASNPVFGVIFGTLKGLCNAFSRTASGAVDIATAPMGKYEEPAVKPSMVEVGK